MGFGNLYTTAKAAKLAGITRRQLDYWISSGIYEHNGISVKNGRGITRLFDDDDIKRLGKMKSIKCEWKTKRKLTISQMMKEVNV